MSVTLKRSKPRRPLNTASVNIFDDVLRRLERMKCTEIGTRVISYGVIYTGLYHGVRFEFNIYVDAQGRLNYKTRRNPVRHKPVVSADELRNAIDEVVKWVKNIEVARDVTELLSRSDRSLVKRELR
jgi:hypothetical protein